MSNFLRHCESAAVVPAPAAAIFARLDDQTLLSGHMSQSSWMMAGSKIEFVFDAERGKTVGSKIGLRGRVLGLPLTVDEVVVERDPPTRKVWETIGTPHLLVIASYRMGFEIVPAGNQSNLTVFIDYNLPTGPWRWLGGLFGDAYARWCTATMVDDAGTHFRRIASA